MSAKKTDVGYGDDLFDDLEKEIAGADNEKEILALVLIDASSSMNEVTADGSGKSRPRIKGAIDGVRAAIKHCLSDPALKRSVLMSIGSFGGRIDVSPYLRVDKVQVPQLQGCGGTPLGEGMMMAMDVTQTEICRLDDEERRFSRANIVIISDGAPNGGPILEAAVKRVADLEQRGDLNLSLIGIDQTDCDRLQNLGLPGKMFCVSKVSWEEAITAATIGGGGTARHGAK